MAFIEYKPTQSLFQYCSREGFFGILKSKNLWFSDLASSNDPREIKFGYDKFIEALKSVRHDEYRGERGLFLSILAGRLAPYHKNVQAFCSCFSLEPDELPMWRAYGANCSGLAIGFRPTALFSIPARIQKVRYLNDDTSQEFRRVVVNIAAQLKGNYSNENLENWISASITAFAKMTALKHSSWSYEREIRMIHVQTIQPPDPQSDSVFSLTGLLPNDEPVVWSKPSERVGISGITHFLEFPLGVFHNEKFDATKAIKKIMIGPNCTLSEHEIIDAMRTQGFTDFIVRKSDCKIR